MSKLLPKAREAPNPGAVPSTLRRRGDQKEAGSGDTPPAEMGKHHKKYLDYFIRLNPIFIKV